MLQVQSTLLMESAQGKSKEATLYLFHTVNMYLWLAYSSQNLTDVKFNNFVVFESSNSLDQLLISLSIALYLVVKWSKIK